MYSFSVGSQGSEEATTVLPVHQLTIWKYLWRIYIWQLCLWDNGEPTHNRLWNSCPTFVCLYVCMMGEITGSEYAHVSTKLKYCKL